ncbi:bifunctional metallophosphatase/5'-nucleotidase [Massilia terrae]|nr:bifunctional metallophosphatase/5'-nucleotidase [Massilia terrae]
MLRRLLVSSLALALAGCASAPRGPVELNLVGLNDFHGNLEPSKYSYKDLNGKIQTVQAGGIEALSGTMRALRREDKDLLFVGAGDLVGASPALSSMWADEPSIEAMNLLGLNDSSLGNHEFDAGRKELLRQQNGGCDSPMRTEKACQLEPNFGGAKFHYLAANVTDSATGQLLVPGWRIEDVKGVKVGVIGAVLQGTPSVAVSWSVRGLSFGDEATAINQAVGQARAKGAQVFVVLIHEGGFAKESSPFQQDCAHLEGPIVDIVRKLDPAVRVVFSGHSHTGYLCKVDGRVVSQAASMGHLLTRVQMKVDSQSGKVEAIDAHNVLVKPGEYEADPKVSALLAKVKARSAALLAKPVSNIGVPVVSRKNSASGESPLGDLIGDAIVAAMREQGAQIGFMNPGGIRKDLEAGSDNVVSFGQAQAVLPFGNTLVVMDMSGAQLRALLEQQWDRPPASETSILQVSGALSYRWDESKPKGSRIVPGSVKVNGAPLDDAKTYRVVANNFLAEGGDEFPAFKQATNKVDTQMRDLDALIAYLKQHPGAGVPAASLAPSARIEKVKQ